MAGRRSQDSSRGRGRIPSGPRPLRDSGDSFGSISSPAPANSTRPFLSNKVSLSSLRHAQPKDAPLDTLLDTVHDFTISPEHSPRLGALSPPPAPDFSVPSTPKSFTISRSNSPIISTPPTKVRPKPSKLNTLNLTAPTSSPGKPLSPGLKHWQQVRSHVLAPTPSEEKPGAKPSKTFNIVSKAAGRFGFRQAADKLLNYEERRQSSTVVSDFGGLSFEEQEEIARGRRTFARDVKACLDACALEESQRRMQRAGGSGKEPSIRPLGSVHKSTATSVHTSHAAHRYAFDPTFSAFAPLLTELHRHLPSARAKRLWSRTCPHHSAILAELGVSFLSDGSSTDADRQQALEVFGVVVRNWASDSAEEEIDRWLWLCRALLVPDRALRNRGLAMLAAFLRADPSLPTALDRPHTAVAFQNLTIALITLLHAIEMSGYGAEDHLQQVATLLNEVAEGNVIDIEQSTLIEVLGQDAIELLDGDFGGLEKDFVWMAVGRVLRNNQPLAEWLLSSDGFNLSRYTPPLLLHAAPPVILHLRSLSTAIFFASLSNLVTASDSAQLYQLWKVAERHLIPDARHLPDVNGILASRLGTFLLEYELALHRLEIVPEDDDDPFRVTQIAPSAHRALLSELLGEEKWKSQIDSAAKQMVSSAPFRPLTRMVRSFLTSTSFFALGRECVSALFTRLATIETPATVKPFLNHLQTTHPQLFYRPLFSLSACTNPANLSTHLQLVRTLSNSLGPTFWTSADPQMVVIVLMGDIAPRPNKGKFKEGDMGTISTKLGRYACLVEFLLALKGVEDQTKALRNFTDIVESRLGIMLEAEEREGRLSLLYKTLICQLFLQLRSITYSLRKTAWQRLVISWSMDSAPSDDGPITSLRSAYTTLSHRSNTTPRGSVHQQTLLVTLEEDALLTLPLAEISLTLLVAVHACLSNDEHSLLLPHLWSRCNQLGKDTKAVVFLMMKCGELVPSRVRDLILSEIYSSVALTRITAVRKLANLYGWRSQVLSQLILTDRRGPVFHFSAHTLEFVATEIGSLYWVPSHDVQDAALQKYGLALPLELRQRLMELGWSEDDSSAGKSDWEQIPVTSLPSLQFQDVGLADKETPTYPMKSLIRHGSSGSGTTYQGKRRKAIFAPVFLNLVSEQAQILAHDTDSLVGAASRDLVRLLQRDDANTFLRPFTDSMSADFTNALAKLSAVTITPTPGFAYVAMNSLIGHLKTILRTHPSFKHYASALATISWLIPHVSGMSLRDIRKNKVEHVLLPASIHEEEGGFKLHQPWRDESYNVQTAQLLILTEMLKTNPREVYLIKKMLSNLQIQASIPHLPFSRAWLVLIATLFSTVNRNYNDRAELRHFLSNVAAILRLHGGQDLAVASHAMRVFILCSARFRRPFASMGFSTAMWSIYQVYAQAGSNNALRDCIEYAIRSFYRIHQDAFVYQTCVVIAEGDFDSEAAYKLLCSLSKDHSLSDGVPSGLRGLNDKEELESLVQMLSGPELTFSEIGTDKADRKAGKMAEISLEGAVFPKENIIKLFVTVIAANPASNRAARCLRLFAGITPHVKDADSKRLLREGVEALGSVIAKGKFADEAAMLAFQLGTDDTKVDWIAARRGYVFLVESYARSGGQLSPAATRQTLEMVLDLLRKQPEAVGPAASSILREMGKTHLSASGSRPIIFLRDIAPLFRMFIALVDFSGLLEEITRLIQRSEYDLDPDTTSVIVDSYVGPAVRMLASASEDNLAFILPMRTSTVDLLAAAVFLNGDALAPLESYVPNASLLACLVLPLCLSLDAPSDTERDGLLDALWIRLLNFVIRPPKHQKQSPPPQISAATMVLSMQAIKIITLRAHDGISKVKGLWNYIARHILGIVEGADGRFIKLYGTSPRILDWMMWSWFELLALCRSPLMIDLRWVIQFSLAAVQHDGLGSQPSTPGEGTRRFSSSPLGAGRARLASARSIGSRIPSDGSNPTHSRGPSFNVTPRVPSQLLTSHKTHTRITSGTRRPSFADISARQTSRPRFVPVQGGHPMAYRFPSSQPVRSLAQGEKGGGAIVHLLASPDHTTPTNTVPILRSKDPGKSAVKELRINTEELQHAARRAVKVCQVVFGFMTEEDPEDEPVRKWTLNDALHAISEQSRLFIEEEFRVVFTPSQEDWVAVDTASLIDKEGYSMDQLDGKYE